MKIRVTLMTENDKPVSALGADPEEKVRKAWNIMLHLISLQSEDSAYVENVEIISENNDEIVRMTDDLISRKNAIEAIVNTVSDVGNHDNSETASQRYGAAFRQLEIIDILQALPSAEPLQKTGKWIHDGKDFPHGNDWIHCSVCGKRGINVPADLTNYCPNCGTRMEREEE